MGVLKRYAPMKKKVTWGNNQPFMNRALSKEMLHRSKLKNSFDNNPTEENKKLYNKQRNYCVYLLKKNAKKLFQ